MKIKEVIRQTNLTDKAIRLYIDNGLVAPSIDESFSGRKSIEFTDNDVERLNNIALLRKAGFSIADIREIIESDEKAQAVVERFIDETESNIQHETEIIEKLKSIPAENGISMKTICESLSDSVEEKKVPKEDLKTNIWEQLTRNFFAILSNIGICISLVGLAGCIISINRSFIHLYFDTNNVSPFWWIIILFVFFGGWIVSLFLSALLLRINQKPSWVKQKNKIKLAVKSAGLLILIVALISYSNMATIFGLAFTPFESYTENPSDYLELDTFVEEKYGNDIRSIFPYRIPNAAKDQNEQNYLETTKYYYRYMCVFDPELNIVADFTLSPYEYVVSKNKALKKEYSSVQKGDWTCLYYNDGYTVEEENKNSWRNETYHFLIFAYNDKENRVRYIASYVVDDWGDGPYYLTLDW